MNTLLHIRYIKKINNQKNIHTSPCGGLTTNV